MSQKLIDKLGKTKNKLPGVEINSLHTTPFTTSNSARGHLHKLQTILQTLNDRGEGLLKLW